ncbi:hypothetical protein RZS08_37920, partial [Arthrospira platensis SPKY1]|nr:hypothetical protein [Arthrospira platensis SPKY1]
MGISVAACSSSTGPAIEDEPTPPPPPPAGDNDQAITVSGSTIRINLTKSEVAALGPNGGWMNITQASANVIVINIG